MFRTIYSTKMSYSKPINFSNLNTYILEDIFKYLKFDDLVKFERINSFWKDAIRSLLRRRKTADYHSCPGLDICDKSGHSDLVSSNHALQTKDIAQAFETKCPNSIYVYELPYHDGNRQIYYTTLTKLER